MCLTLDTYGTSLHLHLHLSRSLADRWGTTVDSTTSFLHSSRFSAFRSVIFHSRPVYSLMSSHRFLCLPLRLPAACVFSLKSGSLHMAGWRFHFLVGYVISIRDTEKFAEIFHLQCLCPSFNVCCYGPHFTYIQNYRHGQGTHQSYSNYKQ